MAAVERIFLDVWWIYTSRNIFAVVVVFAVLHILNNINIASRVPLCVWNIFAYRYIVYALHRLQNLKHINTKHMVICVYGWCGIPVRCQYIYINAKIYCIENKSTEILSVPRDDITSCAVSMYFESKS